MGYPYAQKLTGNTKTEINGLVGRHGSMLLVNNHASSNVTIDLYIASQTKDAITDTSVDVNLSAGYAKTTSSQAIVVDGGTFTDATCDYNNDPTIAHDDDDGAIKVGMVVSGTGIPIGSTVASVTSDTSFELSASTTGGSVTNGTLTFYTHLMEKRTHLLLILKKHGMVSQHHLKSNDLHLYINHHYLLVFDLIHHQTLY